MPKISSKNQITLPIEYLDRSGLRAGDDVAIEVDGPDRLVIRRSAADRRDAVGVFDGLYEPDYLERLRSDERA